MLDIFSGLRLVVKRRTISIDNAIFRCHWFFTSTLLVSFSLIITARQYVGQPIECHSVSRIPESLLNSYCYIQGTFTVPEVCGRSSHELPCIDNTKSREKKMFSYYQYVGIVLFIQGLLFHLPYYLWKVWENGLIKAITGGLRIAVLNEEERMKKKEIVVEYIHDHLGCHKRYAFKYFLCEFICLINLLGQLWGTNKFFDGQFLRYGIDVINYSSNSISGQLGFSSSSSSTVRRHQTSLNSMTNNVNNDKNNSTTSFIDDIVSKQTNIKALPLPHQQDNIKLANDNNNANQVDPMMFIFPRITKCTYYDFGSSGDIQKHDALCLLPLNIINEKIYIALWFWFIILAILTMLVIFYRLFAFVSENVRCKGLISRCKLSNERDIRIICRHCDFGDWFLFYMVAENLDPLIMREIVSSIANKIRAHFDLKRDLGMLRDNMDPTEMDSMYKYKLSTGATSAITNNNYAFDRRASQFQTSFNYSLDESAYSIQNSRRESLATVPLFDPTTTTTLNNNEQSTPFIKTLRKRLLNTKLLLPLNFSSQTNNNRSRQSSTTTNQSSDHLIYRPSLQRSSNRDNPTTNTVIESGHMISSAPPISQMPLNSAPPFQSKSSLNNNSFVRRGSLNRSGSSATTADTFVLEMQTISSGSDLRQTSGTKEEQAKKPPPNGLARLHRRLSSQGGGPTESDLYPSRPKLVRQASLNNQSLRELQLLSNNTNRNLEQQTANNINNLFEEMPILDS